MKYLLILCLIFPLALFGQTVKSSEISDHWTPILEQEGVTIFAKKVLCDFNSGFDEYSIILKIENANNFDVNMSFTNDLYYADDCVNCDFKESFFSFTVGKNAEMEGICSREENNGLRIWDSFEGYDAKKTLSQFVISNVKIEKR